MDGGGEERRRGKKSLPVERIGMHRRHDIPRIISPDRYQSQIKRPPQIPDLGKRGTMRVVMLRAVIVNVLGEFGNGAVAGVAAEPDFLAAAFDAPACPQGVAFVEGGSGAGVLAGETADAGEDVWVRGRGG